MSRLAGLMLLLAASVAWAQDAPAEKVEKTAEAPKKEEPAALTFTDDVDAAKERARSEDKPLLLLVTPDWYDSPLVEKLDKDVLATERELSPALWLMPVPFGVLLALGVAGLRGRPREGTGLLGLFVLANLGSVLIFYFSSRYRLPAVPFVCVFAGAGPSGRFKPFPALAPSVDRLICNSENQTTILPRVVCVREDPACHLI